VEDIPLLVASFLVRLNKEKGRNLAGFSEEAMALLCAYEWPGNICELENLVEQLVILEREGVIGADGLPDKIGNRSVAAAMGRVTLPAAGLRFDDTVAEFEDALIVQALERTKWIKNQAAGLLGMNRTTLVEKIKRRQLEARFNPAAHPEQLELPGRTIVRARSGGAGQGPTPSREEVIPSR
jgi:DNA-binding NtrC family response regulator